MAPNYPNPFNFTTNITYSLPEAQAVYITVFDVLGREVAVLVEGMQQVGVHEAIWDSLRTAGRVCTSSKPQPNTASRQCGWS